MKQIRKMTNPLISEMEKVLNRALDNVYINTALKVFLVLYAALAAPKFPPKLVFLMDNTIVRICVAFLIVFMALRDPAMALMIAIAFIVTLQTANRLRLYNTDLSIGIPGETSWLPSVKEMFFAGDAADAPVVSEEEGAEETEDKCAAQRTALAACEDVTLSDEEEEDIGGGSFTNYENFSVYPSSGAKYSYAPFN